MEAKKKLQQTTYSFRVSPDQKVWLDQAIKDKRDELNKKLGDDMVKFGINDIILEALAIGIAQVKIKK